jgi:hypothetical protein
VAAVLGAHLGPDWTAEAVVRFVRRVRRRPLLDTPDAPVAYLRRVLRQALDSGHEPPCAARYAIQARRNLVAADAEALREHQDATRAGLDARDHAAVHVGRRSPVAEAALAAIRARTSGHLRRPDLAALVDSTGGQAETTRAEEWPEVRQPGSGLSTPYDRDRQ